MLRRAMASVVRHNSRVRALRGARPGAEALVGCRIPTLHRTLLNARVTAAATLPRWTWARDSGTDAQPGMYALAGIVAGTACAAGLMQPGDNSGTVSSCEGVGTTKASGQSAAAAAAGQFLGPDFIADAVSIAAPALVNIQVNVVGGWGRTGVGTGSGFIISEDGYLVTNHHVISGGNGGITVTLSNGRRYDAVVHSADKLSDIALVKIKAPPGIRFPTMKIGTSGTLKPGQWVIALGSPLRLQNTVTAGIISSVARHSSEIGMPQKRFDFLQTDAAINQGASGGPLINIRGEVIGINTLKAAGGDGIGFAIPIDTAWQVIKQLRAHRHVVRPYVGMKMVTLDSKVLQHERLQNPNFPSVESGVMVVQVAPKSPAHQGGLRSGDVIVEFDGRKVQTSRDILDCLGMEVGKSIPLRIVREGTKGPISLTIKTAPNRV